MINCLQSVTRNPILFGSSSSYSFFRNDTHHSTGINYAKISQQNRIKFVVNGLPFPVDPWSPTIDSQIPAGIYAKVHYGTSLSNVDWLHGGAESLLTLTNLFIVIGLRQALRKPNDAKELIPDAVSEVPDDSTPSK